MTIATSTMNVIGDFLRVAVSMDTLGTLNGAITAADTTITLAGGFSSLGAGTHVVKIDSELILVNQSGGTLTVGGNGRAYFGSIPATHANGSTVSTANLNAMVGDNAWEWDAESTWNNEVPAVVFTGLPGENLNLFSGGSRHSYQKPRVQFKSYGGQDSQGEHTALGADIIDRALLERIEQIVSATSLTSGVLASIVSDGVGQRVDDPNAKPRRPFMLRFANAEIQ